MDTSSEDGVGGGSGEEGVGGGSGEDGVGGGSGEEVDKFPCGECTQEVKDNDEAIYCESGCEQWYHRECTGMSKVAYDLLTAEDSAEWACNICISRKAIPMIKMVNKA